MVIGGLTMIDFMKELEKFKPILDVDHIEEKIDNDDMKDLIDILKDFNKSGENSSFEKE